MQLVVTGCIQTEKFCAKFGVKWLKGMLQNFQLARV
jgi:hypothetical protein